MYTFFFMGDFVHTHKHVQNCCYFLRSLPSIPYHYTILHVFHFIWFLVRKVSFNGTSSKYYYFPSFIAPIEFEKWPRDFMRWLSFFIITEWMNFWHFNIKFKVSGDIFSQMILFYFMKLQERMVFNNCVVCCVFQLKLKIYCWMTDAWH